MLKQYTLWSVNQSLKRYAWRVSERVGEGTIHIGSHNVYLRLLKPASYPTVKSSSHRFYRDYETGCARHLSPGGNHLNMRLQKDIQSAIWSATAKVGNPFSRTHLYPLSYGPRLGSHKKVRLQTFKAWEHMSEVTIQTEPTSHTSALFSFL